MVKWATLCGVVIILALAAAPAMAQEGAGGGTAAAGEQATGLSQALISMSGTLGVALVMAAAAYGISSIGTKAVESMARQPEVATDIRTAMMISAALIEGATFFALIVCLII